MNKVIHGDCLEVMKDIQTGSVDMILADLPYGTTRNKWDSIIPLNELWVHYERVIKDNGAIVLTAQTPFDKVLGVSNLDMLRYEWIWEKDRATGSMNANKMPLKAHENILVFYKKLPTYNPQKTMGHKPSNYSGKALKESDNYAKEIGLRNGGQTTRYPRSVQKYNVVNSAHNPLHPTQKPVPLFEYLIKTYTKEDDLVLDNVAGSGTTGIAAMNTNRNYILIEKEKEYIDIINKRIKEHQQQTELF